MPEQQAQFDFLTDYVLKLLEENGLGDLTDEQKSIYVPQLLGQVEQRLGLALTPKLSDAQLDEFTALVNKQGVAPAEWEAFWKGAIPTFEQDVQNVLLEFSGKVKEILGK